MWRLGRGRPPHLNHIAVLASPRLHLRRPFLIANMDETSPRERPPNMTTTFALLKVLLGKDTWRSKPRPKSTFHPSRSALKVPTKSRPGASQGPPSLHSEPRPKETDQRALPYHVRTSLPKDLISEMAAKGVPRQDARE